MNRLTRNALAFTFGVWLVAGVAQCANAHDGHVMDHEDVAQYTFCASVYGHTQVWSLRIGETELAEEARVRSDRAFDVAVWLSSALGHSKEQFAEAATEMFFYVGDMQYDDAFTYAEYLDCDAKTDGRGV